MKTTISTLEELQQTKVEMTKTQYFNNYCKDVEIMAPKVLVYNDLYYIESFGDGFYYLTIDNHDFVEKDLLHLEAILFSRIFSNQTNDTNVNWAIRADKAIEKAQEQFWNCIADSFPEAKSGDLSFTHDIDFRSACGIAVRQWIKQNCNIKL